jgi:hypothetical protein
MTKRNGTHQGTLTSGTVVFLVLTSVVQMLLICTFFTKQATLMKRSTVLRLP